MGNRALARLLGPDADDAPERVHAVLRSSGAPLEPAFRARAESFLGADLSHVRVHTDAAAARSARAVNAHAYTSGDHVAFDHGMYDTVSREGRRRLAHELAHVAQQQRGPVPGAATDGGLSVSDPADAFERAAESAATAFVNHAPTAHGLGPPSAAASPAPGGPTAVQRLLRIGGVPVGKERLPELVTFCQGLFGTRTPPLPWGNEHDEALDEAVVSRTKYYAADSPEMVAKALSEVSGTGELPTWLETTISTAELDEGHRRRELLRYLGHNEMSPPEAQMRPQGSAFHQFPETNLVPVESAQYGWGRFGDQYKVTQPRTPTAPLEPLEITPFGKNTTTGLGYAVWVGDNSEGRQLGHLMQRPKKVTAMTKKRGSADKTYGGWDTIEGMTVGHSVPWQGQQTVPILGPRPTTRRKHDTSGHDGTETFTPKLTSEHPQLFYNENTPWGEGIRNAAIEGVTADYGGSWLQYHEYGATPSRLLDDSKNQVPYPDNVAIRVTFPKGTKRKYGEDPLAADTSYHLRFPNAPDTDYMVDETKLVGGKLTTHDTLSPTDTADHKRRKLLGDLGAHGHFDAHTIPEDDFPVAAVFDPKKPITPFQAEGYDADERWEPLAPHAGYLTPPPSPQLTGAGFEEQTLTIPGRHAEGQIYTTPTVPPEEWEIVEASYQASTHETVCTVVRSRQYLDPFADLGKWT